MIFPTSQMPSQSKFSQINHITRTNQIMLSNTKIKRQGLKPCLYYLLKWCRNSELNQGHRDFQSLALPTELLRQTPYLIFIYAQLLEQVSTLSNFGFTLFAVLSYCGRYHFIYNFYFPSLEQSVDFI